MNNTKKTKLDVFYNKIMDLEELDEIEKLEVLLCCGYNVNKDFHTQAVALIEKYGSIRAISSLSLNDLMEFPGLSPSVVCTLFINLKVAKAKQPSARGLPEKILSLNDSLSYASCYIGKSGCEDMIVIALNRYNKVLDYFYTESFLIDSIHIQPRQIARFLLRHKASSVVVAHSHTSGLIKPSEEDESYTETLCNAFKALDIYLLDHIIYCGKKIFSFRKDNNLDKYYTQSETEHFKKILGCVDYKFTTK